MSRPPLKAMEAVKRYCEKNQTCEGCPLFTLFTYRHRTCINIPERWIIEKEGDSVEK